MTATIIAITLALPIMLLPVALIWYMVIGGIFEAAKEGRRARVAHKATC